MASDGNSITRETNSEQRINSLEQTMMKMAEQMQMLTSAFCLLKAVQTPQEGISGTQKEVEETSHAPVQSEENGILRTKAKPGIITNEPNPITVPVDLKKELEAQNKEMEKRLVQQFNEKMKVLEKTDGFDQMGIISLPTVQAGAYPEKFKAPEFEKYDGIGCPKLHARLYARRMNQYAHYEHIMVQTFQDSLTGPALTWYAQLDLSEINTWDKLARVFYNQYKFNIEVAHLCGI